MRYRIRTDLKQRLRDSGRTIADVSREAGVSYQHINGIFNGRNRPSPSLAAEIAWSLGVPPAAVLDEVDSPQRMMREGT